MYIISFLNINQRLFRTINLRTIFCTFKIHFLGIVNIPKEPLKEVSLFKMKIDDITDLFDGNMDCMEKAFEILGKSMGEEKGKKTKAKGAKKS